MEFELINKYKGQALQPTLTEAIADLDLSTSYTYPDLRAYLVTHKVCSASAFNSARYTAHVKHVLGSFPENAAELVDVIVDLYDVGAGPTGLQWTCPVTEARQHCDEMKLLQEAHRINDTVLGNKFPHGNVCRAVEYWIKSDRADDQKRRFQDVCRHGQFDWTAFADIALEDGRVARDVQVAVIQKFIWQVKRRLAGLPVFDHMMPVIYGLQGRGKSKFVEALTAPLGNLVSSGDFQRLGDIREVAMFEAYIVVLDEMQKATHADVERVKNVITRDTFSFRPMHSNSNVTRHQNATFIGTSNRTLDQMIHDATGNRRFFQIDWSRTAGPNEWEALNALCIEDMWRSVDHLSADPTAPLKEVISTIQKGTLFRSTVGQFFDAVVEGCGTCIVRELQAAVTREFSSVLRKEELFQAYRGYCDHMRIKSPLEAQMFYAEVRRVADQEENCPFKPIKTNKFNGWAYVGPTERDEAPASLSLVRREAA